MEVLDSSYVPQIAEDHSLFAKKQQYVYAVLESHVLTDPGKTFARQYENDFDAQQVYAKLWDHHTKSTKAVMESTDLLSYITSTHLGTGDWHGTKENFILHFGKTRLLLTIPTRPALTSLYLRFRPMSQHGIHLLHLTAYVCLVIVG